MLKTKHTINTSFKSPCKHIKEDLKINDRIIICDKCGKTYDRDINALFEGIKKFIDFQKDIEKLHETVKKIQKVLENNNTNKDERMSLLIEIKY